MTDDPVSSHCRSRPCWLFQLLVLLTDLAASHRALRRLDSPIRDSIVFFFGDVCTSVLFRGRRSHSRTPALQSGRRGRARMMVAIHTDDLFHPLGSSGATGYALWSTNGAFSHRFRHTQCDGLVSRRTSTNLSLSLCCLI